MFLFVFVLFCEGMIKDVHKLAVQEGDLDGAEVRAGRFLITTIHRGYLIFKEAEEQGVQACAYCFIATFVLIKCSYCLSPSS